MMQIGKIITAMVTPFDGNLEVDYKKAAELAEMLLAEGSDGILVAGTTGESPTLTKEEKLKIIRTVRDVIGKRGALIVGTGTNSTRDSISFTRAAEEAGADAALVVAPYYNKPPQEGILIHFRQVAAATRLPIIVYNIPGRTGMNITPDTLASLAKIENIVAVKESSGNLDQISEIAQKTRSIPGFRIMSGDDSLTLPILSVGGTGVISVATHVAGEMVRAMIDAHESGRVGEATALHLKLFPLFKGLFTTTNPILVKAALKLRGFDAGGLRPPLLPATESQEAALGKIMTELNLLMASSTA